MVSSTGRYVVDHLRRFCLINYLLNSENYQHFSSVKFAISVTQAAANHPLPTIR